MTKRWRAGAGIYVAIGGALLSGLAQVLVYPRFSWYWLAPVCLAPLLMVLRDESPKRRFALGWLSGMVFWGGTCYWIYPVMRDYASIAPTVAGLLFIGFFVIKALHSGVFALLAGPILSRWWAVPALTALWVAIEGSHQYLFFTWIQLGNAALDFPLPQIARLAPWTGIYGPSAVFALVNGAVALAILRRTPRPLLALVPLLALPMLPPLPQDAERTETARLIQPNVHPDLLRTSWAAEHGTAHLVNMLEMSKAPTDGTKPSLLVWPEYPVSAYYFDDAASKAYFERVARESGATFVFNTISYEDGNRERPRNSSATLDRYGNLLSQYSKIHLVPFGEFVPWPFHYFVEKITLHAGTFRPGQSISVASADGHGIGTFICYESVFARSIRKFTAGGAQLLVNISNDSWYGRSAAREQHLLIARMRAVENSRWILRSTNDGVTSAISPAGRIVASLPSFVEDRLDVQFGYRSNITWYVRYGEWFWWLCLLAATVACGIPLWERRGALP